MSSLLELWQRVGERDRGISQSLYDVVEALVEAVEPGDTPTDEEYNDTRDDRIRFLQKELAEAKEALADRSQAVGRLRYKWAETVQELAEAKAEIERLTASRASWEWQCRDADQGFAKAKADGDAWMRRCAELERLLAVQKASIADAEIGRLVRKMREDTRLERTGSLYSTMSYCARTGWSVMVPTCATDPAEALRAIQEVGDEPV